MNNTQKYAPAVLRLGLAFVLAWFGLNEVLNPAAWTTFIPTWLTSITGASATSLVLVNGIGELILAVLLAIGFQVRIVASLIFLHLLGIVFEVGLSAIGVRDIGLTVAALSVALHGADDFSI